MTMPVEERVGYVLKRLQQALRAAMDETLRQRGLTTPQYAALSALEQVPGLSNAELARRCFVTPQTMNEVVANLAAAGLVTRRRAAADGRVVQIYLAPQGQRLLADCHRAVETIEMRMISGVTVAERHALTDGLRRCIAALEVVTDPVMRA